MKEDSMLFIFSGWLGDFLWTVPTLRSLRTKYSDISMVVSEQQGPLAKSLVGDVLSEVYIAGRGSNRRKVQSEVRKAILNDAPEIVIDAVGKWKSGRFVPAGVLSPWWDNTKMYIPRKADAKEKPLAKILHPLAKSLPAYQNPEMHWVDSFLKIANQFDCSAPIDFSLNYSDEEVSEAERLMEIHDIRDRKTVALNIGTAQYSKLWPIDYFIALGYKLSTEGINLVFFGADEFKWNNHYDRRQEEGRLSVVPEKKMISESSLMVKSYILSCGAVDVSVACDSYPAHIAGSANEVDSSTKGAVEHDGRFFKANKTVTLFGPTNPFFCKPYDPTGEFAKIVFPSAYPRNCFPEGSTKHCDLYSKVSEGNSGCMMSISVNSVYRAIHEQLEKCSD
jgi:ADP-heptose:LPS heptosyltransferase